MIGGLGFYCTEGREDVEIRILMTSHHLTFSNDAEACPRAGVVLSFDIIEKVIVQQWLRPLIGLNAQATFVTTHASRGSSCRNPLQLHYPPIFLLGIASQSNTLVATVVDVGPKTDTLTRSPSMFFKLDKWKRQELADLLKRCTPG